MSYEDYDVSINDLDSFGEVEEIDPEATVTDVAPPPPAFGPDGKDIIYLARLEPVKDGAKNPVFTNDFPLNCVSKFEVDRTAHLLITVDLILLGDNGPIYRQRMWPNTMVRKSQKTSEVDTIIRAITGKPAQPLRTGLKMKALYDLLVTNPQVQVTIDWIGEVLEHDANKDKDVYRYALWGGKKLNSMRNFPYTVINGTRYYKPVTVDDNGNEVRMGIRVKKWIIPDPETVNPF